jgi:glutathione synthase/RimK-type ligase-like ATP-grasp enzyme
VKSLAETRTGEEKMKRCCFLTMYDLEGFVCDDDLARPPLEGLGWQLSDCGWRNPGVDWSQFDVVVIRSTWDYQSDPTGFLATLEHITHSSALLFNSLDTVRWNLRKSYLADLRTQGVAIVPTVWCETVEQARIEHVFEEFGVPELVLKPIVGANADHAYRVSRPHLSEMLGTLSQAYGKSGFLAQPFVSSVVNEGEYSLFYFGREFSHAILKTPEPGDFRVQEEHGGRIVSVQPDRSLLETGNQVIRSLPEIPLYARVDLVRMADNRFAVMELELIEPSLYFRMDSGAPERFARTLDRWFRQTRDR